MVGPFVLTGASRDIFQICSEISVSLVFSEPPGWLVYVEDIREGVHLEFSHGRGLPIFFFLASFTVLYQVEFEIISEIK